MIKEKMPLGFSQVSKILEKVEETDKTKEINLFIKKFVKITPEKAEKLIEKLEELDLIKLKKIDILKIVDLLPENAVELNKIITEASLDADETNKILDTVKNTK